MGRLTSWIRHLKMRRGSRIFIQAGRMFRFHLTPFHLLLRRIFTVLEENDVSMTFPLVSSTAARHPNLVDFLKSYKDHEIAIHGFKHVRYQFLTKEEQEKEISLSVKIFHELKIPYHGFRAPYNNYTEDTAIILEQHGFEWDGGLGFHPEHRHKTHFFRWKLPSGQLSSYTCIPLCEWSDDRMIDGRGFSPRTISKVLVTYLRKAVKRGGVVMYDLHPIRIGQKKYIQCLSDLIEEARRLDVWVPTVHEAVTYWNRHGKWKGDARACCLITGDIDNFTFFDYFGRM